MGGRTRAFWNSYDSVFIVLFFFIVVIFRPWEADILVASYGTRKSGGISTLSALINEK